MNKLGDFLRAERLKLGLSLGQLAGMVGYKNANKGVRRINVLERTGTGKADMLVNLAEAMGIDWTVVERLAEEDHLERLREWEAWANEPAPMQLVVRSMAAVYSRAALPAWVTTPEQAEAWACDYARNHHQRVCLILSRRHSVWIDEEGGVESRTEATPDQPNMPFMEVKGRRFLFNLE